MVVENLKVFTVKSYKDLFKMYKQGKIGVTQQFLPENLKALKPSKNVSELECIQSLLERDTEYIYHVTNNDNSYVISILGFTIQKVISGNLQVITFGEDGRWEEFAEELDAKSLGEFWDSFQDASNGTFRMEGVSVISQEIDIKNILKEYYLPIKNGDELEEFRDLLELNNLNTIIGYDETFEESEVVSEGFMHYDKGFFLSKNNFSKLGIHFNYLKV